MTQRLVLIGFRGAGKTTLGTELASRLGLEYCSTDKLIEHRIGTSIAEFVTEHGWTEFRRIEHGVIQNLPQTPVVIDCGGGVVESEANMQLLANNSVIVWIDTDVEDIVQRLSTADNAHRPLLSTNSGGDMRTDTLANYERRKPMYERWSQMRVNTSQQTLEHIIHTIAERLIHSDHNI